MSSSELFSEDGTPLPNWFRRINKDYNAERYAVLGELAAAGCYEYLEANGPSTSAEIYYGGQWAAESWPSVPASTSSGMRMLWEADNAGYPFGGTFLRELTRFGKDRVTLPTGEWRIATNATLRTKSGPVYGLAQHVYWENEEKYSEFLSRPTLGEAWALVDRQQSFEDWVGHTQQQRVRAIRKFNDYLKLWRDILKGSAQVTRAVSGEGDYRCCSYCGPRKGKWPFGLDHLADHVEAFQKKGPPRPLPPIKPWSSIKTWQEVKQLGEDLQKDEDDE